MKITEKMLLDHFAGITTCGGPISDFPDGTRIWWEYRTGRDTNGYNPVCSRADATEITLENDRRGTIPIDPKNNDHPSIKKLDGLCQRLFGDCL